jgi:hypothetical protein
MDAPGSLDSNKAGHTDIQNHHVRLKRLCSTHGLQTIGSLTYDLESRPAPQKRTDLFSEYLMIIYNQNS